MRVLVLGGYGAMGQVITRDLTESPEVKEVIVAGREIVKAEALVSELKSPKLRPAQIDATDSDLARKIKEVNPDVLVNASWYEFNMNVMPAAIAASTHYVDLGGLYHMTQRQLKLDSLARDSGVLCVLGMGSTPGVTNVMTAYGAGLLDKVSIIKIRTASAVLDKNYAFQAPFSIRTVLDEFSAKPVVFRNGRVTEIEALSGKETLDFPKPIGSVEGYYTLHSELASMPQKYKAKGCRDIDFIVAYPKDFTEIVASLVKVGMADKKPINVKGAHISPYDFLTEVVRRIPAPKQPVKDVDALRVDIQGLKDKKKTSLRIESVIPYHNRWKLSSGAVDTGVPPSIIAQWIAKRKIKQTGVTTPEDAVEPLPFFKELALRDRGIKVFLQEGKGKQKPLFK
ncbi:MAG TPA: saccharopine dehydrogenase C-terminal domain-containing protein [archaeon]|nr:saccharopine dehydrogenase C-terminal domain-containing protein [archaeon]